jgi:broad specificity phosphatase PhoE
MRHAEPAWHLVAGDRWRGAANDFAPLTAVGEEQAAAAAQALRANPPALVISSPMTRALQTAAIVSSALVVPLRVDLGLREWLPDETYRWTTVDQVIAAHDDMLGHDGVHPDAERTWEELPAVRRRAHAALAPYVEQGEPVLAVCHEVLIHALTGEPRTGYAEVRELVIAR